MCTRTSCSMYEHTQDLQDASYCYWFQCKILHSIVFFWTTHYVKAFIRYFHIFNLAASYLPCIIPFQTLHCILFYHVWGLMCSTQNSLHQHCTDKLWLSFFPTFSSLQQDLYYDMLIIYFRYWFPPLLKQWECFIMNYTCKYHTMRYLSIQWPSDLQAWHWTPTSHK